MKNIPFYCDIACFLFILYVTLNHYINPPVAAASLFPLWAIGGLYFLCRWLFSFIPYAQTLGCIVLITLGIYQINIGFEQVDHPIASSYRFFTIWGTFSHPTFYAGFLFFLVPIATHLIFTPPRGHAVFRISTQIYSFIYILAAMSMLPLCLNRSCLVAGLTGLSVVLFKAYRMESLTKELTGEKRYRMVMWPLVSIIVISLFFAGINYMKKDSTDSRLLIWKVTKQMIMENPWTGIGYKNFAGEYGKAQATYFAGVDEKDYAVSQEIHVAGCPASCFNEYLQITAENGIPAAILFLTILCLTLFYLFKMQELGLLGSMIGFVVFAFLSYPFSTGYISVFFIVLLAMSLIDPKIKEKPRWIAHLPLFFLVLLIYPMLQSKTSWLNQREALRDWHEHKDAYAQDTTMCRRLYPHLRNEPEFLFEWGKCLHYKKEYKESNKILKEGALISSDPMFWNIIGKNYQQEGEYAQAEACYMHAYKMVPNRFYPLYLLTNMYLDILKYGKALEMAEKIVNKDIRVESSTINEMKTDIKQRLKSMDLDILDLLDINPNPTYYKNALHFDEKKLQSLIFRESYNEP